MALEKYHVEIDANEGNDMISGMLKERREWINGFKQSASKKIPEDVKPFYDRFDVDK